MSEISERLSIGVEFHVADALDAGEVPDRLHDEFAAVAFRRAAADHRVRFGPPRSGVQVHGGQRVYVTTAEVVEVLP